MLVQTVISLVSFAATVHAWGDTLAHPVTGTLAQKYLSANGQKLVASLVDSTFSQSLAGQTANWADTWRTAHRETAPWHFVDMMKAPPASCGYVSTDCVGRNCIIAAITDQTNVLLNNQCAPSTASTQAIQFLAHFLGDISQPLHNCNRDVGGNSDKIVFNGAQTNFHSIHDSEIPQAYAVEKGFSTTDAVSVANYLDGIYGKNKNAYTTSTFIDLKTAMANDANSLDCNKNAFWSLYDKDPSADFGGAYYTATKDLLMEQVAKAGYRMAAWMNAIADQCYGVGPVPTTKAQVKTTATTVVKTKTMAIVTTTTTTTTTATSVPTSTLVNVPFGTCLHSPCTAGVGSTSKLTPHDSRYPTCDPLDCLSKIAAVVPHCTTVGWSNKVSVTGGPYGCVDAVYFVCGNTSCGIPTSA
ncbi:phospholipase C/P1 nuclease [Rhizoclosmatium globosum]|uniref:Phospholipase C/P1 nuclease n=1 Tax=Rhizoclosmatium globosum TaxID=329046 RepID=A0A1Y2CTY5_9FUNG|nr:phospholipase C/P1 nuclease [Rhizoclosmatium globosum]|eukprot:ORY50499.1 phospholipase C/P1 nuclease [Rhizoclosmatium globosum]